MGTAALSSLPQWGQKHLHNSGEQPGMPATRNGAGEGLARRMSCVQLRAHGAYWPQPSSSGPAPSLLAASRLFPSPCCCVKDMSLSDQADQKRHWSPLAAVPTSKRENRMVGVQSLSGFSPANCSLLPQGKSPTSSWEAKVSSAGRSPKKGQSLSVVGSETPGLRPCGTGLCGTGSPLQQQPGAWVKWEPGQVRVQCWALSGTVQRQGQSCPDSWRKSDASSGGLCTVGQEFGHSAADWCGPCSKDCSQL